MLSILISDRPLDLPAGLSLNLTLNNPVFDLEKIGRTFSYPFRIPVTPNNAEIFAYAHRLNSRSAQRRYPAKLYVDGVLFEEGVVRVLDRTESTIEISFQNAQLAWADDFKQIKLRDLEMPVSVPGTRYAPIFKLSCTPNELLPDLVMYIEINGILFSGDFYMPDQIIDAINAEFPGLAGHFEDLPPTITITIDASAVSELVINLFPTVVVTPPTVDVYFNPDGQLSSNEEDLKQAWLDYLNGLLTTPVDTHCFPTIEAKDFYDGKNPAYSGYVNYFNSWPLASYLVNDVDEDPLELGETWKSRGWLYTLVPMPYLRYVLQKAFERAGVTELFGDFMEDVDLGKLIVFNNRCLDKLGRVSNFFTSAPYFTYDVYMPYNYLNGEFNLADHLPDISLYDFLVYLGATTFGLTFEVQGSRAYIRSINSQLNQKPVDWTDRFAINYQVSPPQYDAYDLDFNRQGDDSAVSGQLTRVAPSATAEKPLKITSQWFSLYNHQELNYTDSFGNTADWLISYFSGVGISEPYEINKACPVMLLFFLGMQPDSNGDDYPLASHHNVNGNGDEIISYSMNWHGDSGRYERFWRDYIDLLVNGEVIQRQATLSLTDLLAFRENPARPVYLQHPLGNVRGIIREIQVRISEAGVGISTVTIHKEP